MRQTGGAPTTQRVFMVLPDALVGNVVSCFQDARAAGQAGHDVRKRWECSIGGQSQESLPAGPKSGPRFPSGQVFCLWSNTARGVVNLEDVELKPQACMEFLGRDCAATPAAPQCITRRWHGINSGPSVGRCAPSTSASAFGFRSFGLKSCRC